MTSTTNIMHINQFKDTIIQSVQQEESYLANLITRKEVFKAEGLFFNKLGTVELNERQTLNQPTIIEDISHTRRKLTFKTFDKALSVDSFDIDRGMIGGISSDYMQALKSAIGRRKDEIIIEAATGVAYEGKNGEIPITFTSGQTIFADGSFGTNLNGTALGLTTGKLLTAVMMLKQKEVNVKEKIYCLISAEEERNLMQDEKVINKDFTAGQVLDKGIIGSWGRINFIGTEMLKTTAKVGGNREVILFTESALAMGMPGEVKTKISERSDLSYVTQLWVEMSFGATRVEDEKVIKILCKKD